MTGSLLSPPVPDAKTCLHAPRSLNRWPLYPLHILAMLQYLGDGMAQYRDEMTRLGQVQPFGAVNMTSVAEYGARLWLEKLTLLMCLGHLKCGSGGVY